MNFSSDNWAGASQPVMDALTRHNHGSAPAYGADPLTDRITQRFRDIFETDVSVLFTATGTAANALSMAACARPGGLVLASETAHLHCDEWGSAEFYTHGMKILPLATTAGRIAPDAVAEALAKYREGSRFGVPAALSLTQATECGTVYSPGEVAALTARARENGLVCHMDGARFANALVHLGATPAELTWKAGIDVLSFGATKNGCWCAEAMVVFNPQSLPHLAIHRARAGHLFSKSRFVAAQFDGYFEGDHWLDLARSANGAAARLAEGIGQGGRARVAWPVQANEVFAVLTQAQIAKLRGEGAKFYEWSREGCEDDEHVVRLVASFETTAEEVDRFVALL
ncbi:low specificity L-threonine aldolase [Stappia sp. ES.058]|uniref:threonine aldolase family protein n=1 Tax=Stappia sp. ES.058 TaxID=1881061 RepID=UPI00087D5635|nr:low specificity L-threonine aldolase [Stappia sp. ES.058]SDU36035.1 L-threonine aldolase [Stappia sp. ES.058]